MWFLNGQCGVLLHVLHHGTQLYRTADQGMCVCVYASAGIRSKVRCIGTATFFLRWHEKRICPGNQINTLARSSEQSTVPSRARKHVHFVFWAREIH